MNGGMDMVGHYDVCELDKWSEHDLMYNRYLVNAMYCWFQYDNNCMIYPHMYALAGSFQP